jgi:hypothetical protein
MDLIVARAREIRPYNGEREWLFARCRRSATCFFPRWAIIGLRRTRPSSQGQDRWGRARRQDSQHASNRAILQPAVAPTKMPRFSVKSVRVMRLSARLCECESAALAACFGYEP